MSFRAAMCSSVSGRVSDPRSPRALAKIMKFGAYSRRERRASSLSFPSDPEFNAWRRPYTPPNTAEVQKKDISLPEARNVKGPVLASAPTIESKAGIMIANQLDKRTMKPCQFSNFGSDIILTREFYI